MKRTLFAALGLTLVTATATAAPFAYVANEKSGTISIIDTATDVLVGTINSGGKPRGQAVSLDGSTLYASESNGLLVIDIANRTVSSKIDLGDSPEGVGISADGKWVAVAVEMTNSAALIDTTTGKPVYSVKTQGQNPEHAEFSPDGKCFMSAPRKPTRSTSSILPSASRWRR